jgi:hypothetical protein
MTAPRAVASRAPSLATQMTAPFKRRTPMIAAALVSLGILGGAAAVVIATKSKTSDTPAKQPEPVATAPSPAEPSPPPPQPPVEAPVAPVEAIVPATGSARVEKIPAVVKKTPIKKTPVIKTPVKTAIKTTEVTPPPPPVEVTPAPKPIDASMLAARYQSVGSALKSLEQAKGVDAVADLWPRYRFIRIADAMKTQDTRDQAAAILAKLATEIAARKR